MEISVKLPNSLYQDVSHLAAAKKKSVDEIIKNAVQKAITEDSVDFEEQAKIIERSVQFCSDKEIVDLASLQVGADRRVSHLFEKNRESVLTRKEHVELTKAVGVSRLNDLRKAMGIVEAKKRGLI